MNGIKNDNDHNENIPKLGILSETDDNNTWGGIGDYDADSESSFYEKQKRRDKTPIKDRPIDMNNPIVKKIIQRMIHENFMADEPDINIRLESYKRKLSE